MMPARRLAMTGGVIVAAVWFGLPPVRVSGQPVEKDSASAPRTPWGDPDLQGIWSPGYYLTPLQRPDRFQGREYLTDAEVADLESQAAASPGRNARLDDAFEDLQGAYNDVFTGRGTKVIRTRRTSLIVDPPDGRIPIRAPSRTAANAGSDGPRRRASYILDPDEASLVARTGGFDGPEDRRNDRCLGVTLPFIGGTSGTFSRLVQGPGSISLFYEDGHRGGIFRTVHLDGRPHLPPTVRQWTGHSVGRWEGETLVVDTTNFTDKTNFNGARENLHLTERYTRVAPDLLMYRVTVDDPTVFARPWTVELPLTKVDDRANPIFEAACHEGNHAMVGILAGARALEKEQAGKKRR